jgi:hypothetical protein
VATLRNKTTSEGVIILWKPYPDHGRPSTYQVTSSAVSLLADLGYDVPNPGDEAEIPWDICRPLRILDDLYFKNKKSENIETENISDVGEEFAQSLSSKQRHKLLDYISNHSKYHERSEELDNEISLLPSVDDTPDISNDIDSSKLECGEIITAEVSRVTSSGNGIIEKGSGHINVGPLKADAEGSEIRIEIINPTFAVCITEEARSENYISKFWKINRNLFYKYERPDIESVQFCLDCGSVALKQGNLWTCGTCDTKLSQQESGDFRIESDGGGLELPETGEVIEGVSLSIDSRENICAERDSRIKINGDANLNKEFDVKVQAERIGYVVATVLYNDEEKSMEQLREEAKEAAEENVTRVVDESTSKTVSYSRSQKVKDYVKARAGGVCEGCDKYAPFTSKSGEPYLQVHHLDELSQGGSDTPDNVIA